MRAATKPRDEVSGAPPTSGTPPPGRSSAPSALFSSATTRFMPSSTESSPDRRSNEHSDGASPPPRASRFESEFTRGLRKELSMRLATPVSSAAERERDLLELGGGSSGEEDCGDADTRSASAHPQGEDFWGRETALVREQLEAAVRCEAALQRRVRDCEAQLDASRQEIERLRRALADQAGRGTSAAAGDTVASTRERELLRFIVEIVGKDAVRSVLVANPHAAPAELRQKLRHLHLQQAPPPLARRREERRPVADLRRSAARANSPPHQPKQQDALDAIYDR